MCRERALVLIPAASAPEGESVGCNLWSCRDKQASRPAISRARYIQVQK
jgi:hypothetical protein